MTTINLIILFTVVVGMVPPNINSTDKVTLHRLQEHLELTVDYTVYEPLKGYGRHGSSQKSGIISGKDPKDQ